MPFPSFPRLRLLLFVLLVSGPKLLFSAPEPGLSLDSVSRKLEQEFSSMQFKIVAGSFEPSPYAREHASWTALQPADSADYAAYAKIFAEEWRKYPSDWVKGTGLKAVIFVKKLKVGGQPRAAMPDVGGMALYFDIDYLDNSERYVRKVVHHEFFHLIEHARHGSMYYTDHAWLRLNPRNFHYGQGGATAYTDEQYRARNHPATGFVSVYATYSPEEDKAEIYAYLFTSNLYGKLLRWAKSDSVLAEKIHQMRDFIHDAVPAMDGAYFDRIHQGEASDND